MDKTFLELCSRYEDVAPAEIPAAAMKVADAACAQLQTVHDTVPAGEQTAAAKEIIATVSGVKKALLDRVEQFHDELNPNVLSAFHDGGGYRILPLSDGERGGQVCGGADPHPRRQARGREPRPPEGDQELPLPHRPEGRKVHCGAGLTSALKQAVPRDGLFFVYSAAAAA